MAMASETKETRELPPNASLSLDQQTAFNKKVQELKKRGRKANVGVIYIGHIPHGFFEEQMRAYFKQFGTVLRLKLSRSKKTGRSKGYGFVEFESEIVAKIVADTMNNYLMFNKLLKCQLMLEDKVHRDTFKGCRNPFSQPKSHTLSIARHNRTHSAAKQKVAVKKCQKKAAKTVAKLAEMGITYDCSSVMGLSAPVLPPSEKDGVDADSEKNKVTSKAPVSAAKVKRLANAKTIKVPKRPKQPRKCKK